MKKEVILGILFAVVLGLPAFSNPDDGHRFDFSMTFDPLNLTTVQDEDGNSKTTGGFGIGFLAGPKLSRYITLVGGAQYYVYTDTATDLNYVSGSFDIGIFHQRYFYTSLMLTLIGSDGYHTSDPGYNIADIIDGRFHLGGKIGASLPFDKESSTYFAFGMSGDYFGDGLAGIFKMGMFLAFGI